MIVALAGGVGGARLALGLARHLPAQELTVVVNTGDDFEHLGLRICPDLDTVLYTLAGVNNRVTGWGRANEGWNFMATLAELGADTWFKLGDKDVALHVLRTHALARGRRLSELTTQFARRFGVRSRLLPMSDTPVSTRVHTARAVLPFQDYFVRLQCRPRVTGFSFQGAETARVPEALAAIMRAGRVRAVVLCPSNPFVSVAPILSVAPIKRWLERRRFPVVAVSPIVGGAAIKGPAAKMMRELGLEISALGLARHYGSLVDGWVIDRRDAHLAAGIEARGQAALACDTVMSTPAKSARLAARVCAFAGELARGRAS